MELITMAAVSALSIALSLAGSRVMLGALFSLMMRTAGRHGPVPAPRDLVPAAE